jgi:preprotein translocase subunit SecG
VSGFIGRRGAGCNAPPCSDSSFSAEDARILVRAFIISALIWSVIIMIFAFWEKLREKTEEKEIKQNRREAHHFPNGRGELSDQTLQKIENGLQHDVLIISPNAERIHGDEDA